MNKQKHKSLGKGNFNSLGVFPEDNLGLETSLGNDWGICLSDFMF